MSAGSQTRCPTHLTKQPRSARRGRFQRRLLAYSATAGAALAVVGTSDPARGNIIYTSGSYDVNSTTPNQTIDLDGHGQAFRVGWNGQTSYHPGTPGQHIQTQYGTQSIPGRPAYTTFHRTHRLFQSGRHGNWIANGAGGVNRLGTGDQIGPAANWATGSHLLAHADRFYWGWGSSGSFGSRGYIGVKFNAPGGSTPLYGWIDFGASTDGATGTIYGWAYEDSGGPMLAGQTVEVPEPGTLAMLAAGMATAACAAFFKRRKQAV